MTLGGQRDAAALKRAQADIPRHLAPFYANHLVRALRQNAWHAQPVQRGGVDTSMNRWGTPTYTEPELILRYDISAEDCDTRILNERGQLEHPAPGTLYLTQQHYRWARVALFHAMRACGKCAVAKHPSPSSGCRGSQCTFKSVLALPYAVFVNSSGRMGPQYAWGMKKAHAEVALGLLEHARLGYAEM